MPLQPGDRFGRYEITELLGKGGMGEVYRAQDTLLHRRVALKILHAPAPGTGASTGSNQTDGAARILREARAAAGIEHPNAISIYDVGEVDGVPFLAMEFVSGTTLRAFIGDPAVTLGRRIRWLVDIARALGAAHALGLVHRDIKPENVMVRSDGMVKVLDFGIARRAATRLDPNAATEAPAPNTLTADGVVVGTPFYMAPEQMRGESLDGRADQFAWGVLAYELLTGALPWDRDSDGVQLVAQILSRDVVAPRERNAEIPAAIDGAIRMALNKSASNRFASMDDAAAALEPHAAAGGVATGRSDVRRSVPVGEPISLAPTEALPSGASGAGAKNPSTRTQLATPGPTPSLVPPKRGWKTGAAIAGVALAVAAAAWRFAPGRTANVAPPADAAPAPHAESEMSANAEATAAYRAGMQALRDGSIEPAHAHLDRAIELDPLFGAAHLRRAVLPYDDTSGVTPQDLQIARSARGSLGDHDRAVLEAMEPWTRVPADLAESARRFEAALKREPADADFSMLLAWTLDNMGEKARASAAYDAALASDPSLAIVHCLKARERLVANDVPGAMAGYGRCLNVSSGATSCLDDVARLQSYEGKCQEQMLTLRRMIAVSPGEPEPYEMLAEALFAVGDSIDAVRAALAQALERTDPRERKMKEDLHGVALAILSGQFDEALRLDRDVEGHLVANPRETFHFIPAYDRMLVNLETGRNAEVLRLASDYLARRSAWQRDELTQEQTIFVYAAQRDAGGLTDAKFLSLREGWLARDRKRAPGDDGPRWIFGHALTARTPDEATATIAARPEGPVGYALSTTLALENEPIGRAYLLAGKLDEAIPYLRRASESCASFALWGPEFSTWSSAELGEALEARGDTAGACAAYGRVLRRWGGARPPSRTATRARARAHALACPP